MPSKVFWWVVLFVCCAHICSWAQQNQMVSGTVKQCLSGQPIVGAHVMLCLRTDSSVAVFAATNSDGQYQLKKPSLPQVYFLKITSVGFADTSLAIPTTNEPIICLNEKTFNLKEVHIVAAELPIKQEGDTTTYKVDAFAKNQEQTLEQVLRRLPNVRVEQNGDVFFKNKKIEKIFIEGDNLSGDKYQTLTRSIDPAMLDQIQAIENFSENKILKSFGGANQTVLNLTIKKERKKFLFGTAELRSSIGHTDANATLISYLNKTKQLLLGSGNNAGIERSGGIAPNNSTANEWIGMDPAGQNLFNSSNFLLRLFGTPIENFNNERILQYNLASPITKKAKVNAGFSGFKDQNRAFVQRETRFITDIPFVLNQTDSAYQNLALQKAHLQLNLEPNAKTSVLLRGNWQNYQSNISQQSMFLQQTNAPYIAQEFGIGQQTIALNAELTRKISQKNALLINLDYNKTELSDKLSTNALAPSLADTIFTRPVTNAVLQQHLYQQRNSTIGMVKWFYADSFYKSSTWVGGMQNKQIAGLEQKMDIDQTQSMHSANLKLLSIGHEGGYKYARFECKYHLEASNLLQGLDKSTQMGRWFLQPTAMISYLTDRHHFWILNIARKANYLEGINLINAPILTDFRTAQIGRANLMLNPSISSTLSYLYNDYSKHKISILTTLIWNKNQQLWGYNNNVFLPEYSLMRIGRVAMLNNYVLNLNIEKLLYSLRSNIKADISAAISEFENVLNSQQRNTISQLVSLKYNYLSTFEFPINFEISNSHRLSIFRNNDGNSRPQTSQKFIISRQTATLFAKIKKVTWRLETERNVVNNNVFWVFNSMLNCPLNSRLQGSIEGRNLLNTNRFSYFQLSPISALTVGFPVLPRFVLVGLKYNFR